MAPVKEAFHEVPAGRLVTAAVEVSLIMGLDNLCLFPSECTGCHSFCLF
jgi:hypothetical protein